MSDHRKNGQDEPPFDPTVFDFEDGPSGAGSPDVDFAFETMPEPGSEREEGFAAPQRAPVTPRFAETDEDEPEVDVTPARAPGASRQSTGRAAAPAQDHGDFSDISFGGEELDEPRQAPRRVVSQAPEEPEGGDDDGIAFAGAPVAAAGRRGRQQTVREDEAGDQDVAHGDDVGDEIDEAEAPRRKSPLSYAPHVGGALLVIFVAYVGWVNVGSFLGGSSGPATVDVGGPAPKQAMGVPAPVLPVSDVGPKTGLPGPNGVGGLAQASVGPAPSLPALRDPNADIKPVDVSQLGGPSAGLPASPAPSKLQVEPVALQAPGAPVAAPSPDLERRLADLEARRSDSNEVASLKSQLETLKTRLASVENRVGDAAPRPSVNPPSKPSVIKGWTLQGVSGGAAWVRGPNGPKDFHEVRVGQDIPGVGLVNSIANYESKFVVITSAGVILEK